jgi:threonine synthase
VQSQACAPFYEAYRLGLEDAPQVSPGETIAEGIRIARPSRGRQVLRAVRETGGAVVAVDDAEIADARLMLARIGLYVEPTSATAVAGLSKMDGTITPDQITVVALTGCGLKSG